MKAKDYVLRVDEILDGYVCCTGWIASELKAWQDHKMDHDKIATHYVNIEQNKLVIEKFKGDDGSTIEPCTPSGGDILRVRERRGVFRGTLTRHIITEKERAKLRKIVSKLKEDK